MQIVSDHGFPKANDDESAFDAFKNEREYIAQSGRLKTTVAAMDWAMREIERLTAENERLRKLLDAVANQGWQEIDDDLRRQIRAYQQLSVNSEEGK